MRGVLVKGKQKPRKPKKKSNNNGE